MSPGVSSRLSILWMQRPRASSSAPGLSPCCHPVRAERRTAALEATPKAPRTKHKLAYALGVGVEDDPESGRRATNTEGHGVNAVRSKVSTLLASVVLLWLI